MPLISPTVQELGVFASGEIPIPVIHQYVDYFGAVVNLTGFLIDAFVESRPGGTGQGAGVAAIVDPVDGIVQYSWVVADTTTVGSHRLQIWVWNNPMTQRYASDIFAYECYEGVGPV